ncbi:hypothetical protein BT69DRAFT_1241026 [Atractiella rhizophila]|nr:hypothetical protein BT69DRAFT_1241026 [Atractiella rhizophila]
MSSTKLYGVPTSSDSSLAKAVENANLPPDHNSANLFTFSLSAWLAILSLPMLLFPRFLALALGGSNLLTSEINVGGDKEGKEAGKTASFIRELNDLEKFFAALTGFAFLSLSLLLVLQTGAVPVTSSMSRPSDSEHAKHLRTPTVTVLTLFLGAISWLSWREDMKVFGGINGAFAFWAFWVVLFSNEKRKRRVEGGKDDKLSSFPFKNKVAHARKEQ